jgi:hypothetical protein
MITDVDDTPPNVPPPHVRPPRRDWRQHLAQYLDLDQLLKDEAIYRPLEDPFAQPGYRDHRRSLRLARTLLLEALDVDPADREAVFKLHDVEAALARHPWGPTRS